MLARSDFENAVKDALRHYTQADLLAENALLRTRLLTSSKPGAATPQVLRALLAETAKALFAGERDQRLYHVLDLTYLNPAPKQETAANRLGLSYSTYRRHLTAGVDRLTEWLWKQELEARRVETVAEQATGSGTVGEELSVQSQRPRLSIVILPFLNLSQDPSVDYLVDGIGDGLMTDLSRALPGSFVISRSTAFTYKGRRVPVPQVGQELGVRYVLEGSVLVDPSRIRVNVQLIDALTDEHVWAERFDKDRKDALEAQDQIVGRLSRCVGIEMVCSEAARGSTGNSADVIDLVMRARELANDIRQRENIAGAIELLRQALELDPDRRKLLAAMAALCEKPALASEKTAPIAPATPKEVIAGSTSSSAERRQLTVMFCDLVGSTALSARLDPEDLREVIGAYHHTVAEVVAGFDGFVAKYMGDGALVYFGYPRAHEDDAERAVRAGLGIIDAVGHLDVKSVKLQARVGIATGLVVVGDLFGEISGHEQSVVGETPNLAARLQALAEPNAVVIAASTRRLVGELFEYRDLGGVEVKGIAEPMPAWRILRPSVIASRFEALRGSALTPLVGRDEEVEVLLRRWERTKDGDGRVVLISGEPGIGKSRLTVALYERIEPEPHTRWRYFCSSHHQDSALHPFIAQLEHAAGFARDDTVESKLDKLRALLSPRAQDGDDITLLSELVSLPSLATDLNLSPQRKREKLFEALLNQLEAGVRRRPVLMVFEDAHWIDPTSRELLDLMLDRVSRMRVLLIVTFRPEFQHAWGGQPHVTMLALNRLDRRDGAALVERLAGDASLSREIVDEIAARADGVPLFVEELTKAVLESGDRDKQVAALLAPSPLPELAVPATLYASLIARLDRLGPIAKEIGQIGAVLGREFGYDLIEPVVRRPSAELRAGLDRLAEAGLLFCRGVAPQSSYLFKHALVQDTAYSTLLRARRQDLHARVAAVLEERFADLVERQPELLAHHLTAAGDSERAVDQWLKAGQFAAVRSAHLEAIGHFDRGLAVLDSLPEKASRDRWEVELQLARGLSLLTAKGFGSTEAVQSYARARDLCEKSGDSKQLFVALWNLWLTTAVRDIDAARPLSNQLLTLTETRARSALRLQAHHSAWFTRFIGGEPSAALSHCDEGRHLYNIDRHRSLASLYGGHDPGVCALQTGALSEWLLGYPDKALASINGAVNLAERLGHPFSLAFALLYQAVLYLFRREPDVALHRAHEAEAFAVEQRLALLLDPNILRGKAFLTQGAVENAVASVREGVAARQKTGWDLHSPYHLGIASEVLGGAGDYKSAAAALAEAEMAINASNERWWEAEIHRLKGVLLLSQGNAAQSESCFERSIRIARQQQATSLELRAATNLARLWGDQGRRPEARNLLAPVYGWFTEGFDTPDLKDARALLDALNA